MIAKKLCKAYKKDCKMKKQNIHMQIEIYID